MKQFIVLGLLLLTTVFTKAQYHTTSNANGKLFYTNPIFAGDYPDPTILRDGDDYYMVHSSFEYYLGLFIWHSKNLINWSPVKNILYKYVASVWAPDLAKHKNRITSTFPPITQTMWCMPIK